MAWVFWALNAAGPYALFDTNWAFSGPVIRENAQLQAYVSAS